MDASLSGTDDKQFVIAVRGEIDLGNTDSLLRRLVDLAHPCTGKVAFDLSQVGFIDCAGLHMLTALDRYIQARGGGMRIVAASPAVARLFELLDMLAALPAYFLPDDPGRSTVRHAVPGPGDEAVVASAP